MRNTIRKVMIVVPVLMSSCQLSNGVCDQRTKSGYVNNQATIDPTARAKARELPVQMVACRAKRSSGPGLWSMAEFSPAGSKMVGDATQTLMHGECHARDTPRSCHRHRDRRG